MTGTIKRTTPNYALGIPYFDVPGWGAAIERDLNIIDAVLGLVSAVPGVVGSWENNTDYVIGDRVVDTDDDTVWQCNVVHTSAISGTFAEDRATNPTYWTVVTREIVVRGEAVEGTTYYIGDFVYSEAGRIGGVVTESFVATADLLDNINDLALIYDLRAFVLPTVTTAGSYLKRNAGNTAYEEKTAAEVGADVASGVADTLGIPAGVADTYLRRNAGNTAYETKTAAQVLTDIGGIGGSAGATDNRLVRSDGVGGKTLQATGVSVDDSNNVTGLGTITSVADGVANNLIIGSTASGNIGRNIIFQDSSGTAAGVIQSLPNAPGVNSILNFYVGGANGNDIKLSIDDDGVVNLKAGQLKFPVTQNPSSDPNTMDDYEEGTFTPVMTGSSSAGTGTYTRQFGRYTKIGQLLNVFSDLSWTAHTGSGNMYTSLPMAPADVSVPAAMFVNNMSSLTSRFIFGQTDFAGGGLQLVYVNQDGSGGAGVPVDTTATLRSQISYAV